MVLSFGTGGHRRAGASSSGDAAGAKPSIQRNGDGSVTSLTRGPQQATSQQGDKCKLLSDHNSIMTTATNNLALGCQMFV